MSLHSGLAYGREPSQPVDFEMTKALGQPHHQFSFAYSNFAKDGNLLRRFVLTQKEKDGPATLIDFHFEYLVEGSVRTFTLNDVGYVVPFEGGLDVYFYRIDERTNKKEIFSEERFQRPSVMATLTQELQKIRIKFGRTPTVTTHFFKSYPRATVLTQTDARSRFDRLYENANRAEVETFGIDQVLTDRIFALGGSKPKHDLTLTGFGWYAEAKRRGLLIELPKAQDRDAAIGLKLVPQTGKGFVFTQAEDSERFEIHRFLVSGNVRELGQFLALVNLYNPADFAKLLEFKPIDGDPGGYGQFEIFTEVGGRGESIGERVRGGETDLFPFRSMKIDTSCAADLGST